MSPITQRTTDRINPPPGAALFGATYISRTARSVRSEQIVALVAESRRRNAADELSGVLVRAGQNFVQYLEGPQAQVIACLRRIETDSRHYGMQILAVGAMDARRFPDWSMGYFVGDAGGCERLERSLTRWQGTDRSLMEEIWRIADAARTGSASVEDPQLIMGPFEVLLRRRG